MFSKRSPLDFLLFSGIFLTAQGILSSTGGLLVSLFHLPFATHYGDYSILGYPIPNSAIWGFQHDVLIAGIVLALASATCMGLFGKKNVALDGGRTKGVLPSRRLFADFTLIMGILLGVTAFQLWDTWAFYNNTPIFYEEIALDLSLVFASLVLLGTSVYLWLRERKIAQRSAGHRLLWEISTSCAISAILFFYFIFAQGVLSLPLLIPILQGEPIPAFLAFWVTLGLYSIYREERKLSSLKQEAQLSPEMYSV